MKKSFMFPMLTLAMIGSVTFAGYKSLDQNLAVVELMLGENIEALTYGENGYGGYTRSTGACPSPCEYKKWVSCRSGGVEDCFPSDCC